MSQLSKYMALPYSSEHECVCSDMRSWKTGLLVCFSIYIHLSPATPANIQYIWPDIMNSNTRTRVAKFQEPSTNSMFFPKSQLEDSQNQ